MEKLDVMDIVPILRKRSGKLALPVGSNLGVSINNARNLAAYFFQQYGLSGEAARLIEDVWPVTSYELESGHVVIEEHLYPMLMIEDTAVVPANDDNEEWVLLEPYWDLYPKTDPETDEKVVHPSYELDPPIFLRMKLSLYDAVVSAVLYNLYDTISRDVQGLTKDYLDATTALDAGDELVVLLDTLVVPAVKTLLNRLPYLRPDRWDQVYVEKDPGRIRVFSNKLNFDYYHYSRTWLAQVQTDNTWSDLNPISFNPLTVVQLLQRREFLPVFLNMVATLITRRKIEIERDILAAKAAK